MIYSDYTLKLIINKDSKNILYELLLKDNLNYNFKLFKLLEKIYEKEYNIFNIIESKINDIKNNNDNNLNDLITLENLSYNNLELLLKIAKIL